MAVSKREEAIAALHQALRAVSGVSVWRSPNWPLGFGDFPAVVLEDGAEEVANLRSGILDITTTCIVSAIVKAASQETLGSTLNTLAAQVRAAVSANPTLSGTVIAADYMGCKIPEFVLEANGSPPHASIDLIFDLRRQEAEHNPYAYQ